MVYIFAAISIVLFGLLLLVLHSDKPVNLNDELRKRWEAERGLGPHPRITTPEITSHVLRTVR